MGRKGCDRSILPGTERLGQECIVTEGMRQKHGGIDRGEIRKATMGWEQEEIVTRMGRATGMGYGKET